MRRRRQAILYEFLENKSPGGLGAPGLRGSVHESGSTRNTRLPQPGLKRKKPGCTTGLLLRVTRFTFRGGVPSVNHPHNSVNPGLVPGQRNRRPGLLPAP